MERRCPKCGEVILPVVGVSQSRCQACGTIVNISDPNSTDSERPSGSSTPTEAYIREDLQKGIQKAQEVGRYRFTAQDLPAAMEKVFIEKPTQSPQVKTEPPTNIAPPPKSPLFEEIKPPEPVFKPIPFGRIDSEALFADQEATSPETAPEATTQPPIDTPFTTTPPKPEADIVTPKGSDLFSALDLSFDDLFSDVGNTQKTTAPTETPYAPKDDLSSLDLDRVLREDSVPDARIPSFERTLDETASWEVSKPPEPRGSEGIPLADIWPSVESQNITQDTASNIPEIETSSEGTRSPEIVLGPALEKAPPLEARPVAPKIREKAARQGQGIKVVLLVFALVCLIGVVLGQTEYGYFGINLFIGDSSKATSARKALPQPGTAVGIVKDTKESFQQEIRRLEGILKDDPKNIEARGDLLEILLRYRERFPLAFEKEERLKARLKELQTEAAISGQKADIVRVMDLVASEKYDEARALLDGMVVASAQDADVLYFYGKIALGQGKPEEAIKYFELTLLKNPALIAAKYFLAIAHMKMKENAKATTILNELLTTVPDHLPGKVRLAELALVNNDINSAERLAKEVISKGNVAVDATELFDAHMVLASTADLQGARDERLRELQAALNIIPAHEETAILVSRLLSEAGKNEEALAVLEPCRVKPCTSEEFLATYAEAALKIGRNEIAEAALKEGEERYPQSPRFALIKGRNLLQSKHNRAAIDAFERALKIDSKSEEALVLLAEALRGEGKLSEAANRLNKALEAGDSVPLLLALASVYREQHDFTSTEMVLRRAAAIEPTSNKIQQDLAIVIAEQGRYEEASRILAALDAKQALDVRGQVMLARAYTALKDIGHARDLMARLYTKYPDDPDIAAEYGAVLIEGKNKQRAEDVLKKATHDFPAHAGVHYQLGRLYVNNGDYAGAVEELARAVNLAPNNQRFRLDLARTLISIGGQDRLKDARQHLDTVIAAYNRGDVPREERDPDAFFLRGNIFFNEQKYGLAMKDFEAALELAPSRTDVLIGFGRSLFEMSRYSEAEPYFKQVLTRDVNNAEANYYLGWILLRRNKIDDAKVHFERTVARAPKTFPEAYRQLGLIYKDENLKSLARRAFQNYLEYANKGSAEAEEVKRILEYLKK